MLFTPKGHFMNWYPRFPGDYLRDTRHLSLAEHGAYTLLLDAYFSTGRFPKSIQESNRIASAHSPSEKRAVASILAQFFTKTEEGYENARAKKVYEEQQLKSEIKRRNGSKGGRPKKATAEPKHKPTENLQVSPSFAEPEPDIYKNPPKAPPTPKKMTRPTLAEVTEYCASRGRGVDAQSWFDHYEANGWKVGRNAMKDWKAAVRTWERNTGGRDHASSRTSSAGRAKQLSDYVREGITSITEVEAGCEPQSGEDDMGRTRGHLQISLVR